jgi:hypothetical protein
VELILVVVGAIAVTAIAHRRGLEPALIIVVIGIAVSFLPGFSAPELDSHILLSVVLPLLYSAALDFSFPTFLRNIRPILGLGVGLVVVTAFVVAAVSSWLVVVPLTFGTALVLGAIVAPPDAVTAVAVGRKLGLPKRVMAILTGESLINDAAALALLSVAVVVVADTEHAGNQLEQRICLSVFSRTRVSGDRFGRLVRDFAVGVHLKPEGRRKTFMQAAVRLRIGFAIHRQTKDAIVVETWTAARDDFCTVTGTAADPARQLQRLDADLHASVTDPHLGGLGRCGARVRGDRPGQPRRRQRRR